jgi:hypothetical protein
MAEGDAGAGGVTAATERRTEINELPSMAKITGLKPVEQGVALSFVPQLRAGPTAEAHATEKTALADGVKKGVKMHGLIDDAIEGIHIGKGLVDYVPDGCVDIKLRNARSFKANHLAIFELRVLEEYLEFIKEILVGLGCVVFESIVEDIPDSVWSEACFSHCASTCRGHFRRSTRTAQRSTSYKMWSLES